MKSVDLNCDLGESFGRYTLGLHLLYLLYNQEYTENLW